MTLRPLDELINFLVEQGFISSLPHREEYSDEELLKAALAQMRENINYGKVFRHLQSLHELLPRSSEKGYGEVASIVQKRALDLFPASQAVFFSCEDKNCDEECMAHLDSRVSQESLHQELASKGYFSRCEEDVSTLVLAFDAGGKSADILILKQGDKALTTPPFIKMASLFSFFASAALARGRSYDLLKQNSNEGLKKKLEEEHEKSMLTENLLLLSQFTVGLNHEINNPLAVIKGALFLMKKNTEASQDEVLTKNISRIEDAVSAISEIVQNLENLKKKYKIKEYLKDVHMVDFSMGNTKEE
jgi:K+-sensing histidine kinase KdpD